MEMIKDDEVPTMSYYAKYLMKKKKVDETAVVDPTKFDTNN